MARLTSCARTHVHGGDRRTSGAAAAWGRPVPALEKIFRPRGTKHAALRPPSQCPGGAPVPTVSGATADLSGPASPARPPVAASPASPHGPRPARSPSRLPRLRPPRSPPTVAARPPRPRPAPRGSRSLRSLRPRPCSGSHAGSISVLFLTRPQRPRALLSSPGWPRGGWVLSPCVLLLFPDVFCILLPQTATPAGGADAETQAAPRPAGAVSA